MLGLARGTPRIGAVRARWKTAWVLLLLAVAAVGWSRVRFETDVLAVLPADLPEVQGLRAFQEAFARDDELVILVESDDGAAVSPLREELAERLEADGLAARVRWQSPWRDDPGGLGELIAWLWLHAEPEALRAQTDRLAAEALDDTLGEALERVATALGGTDVALAAHDPLGLAAPPALRDRLDEAAGGGYENADGTAGFLLVEAPEDTAGYAARGEWIAEIRERAGPWAEKNQVRLGFTGDPAFEAEIGGAMQRDMSGTVAVTSLLVAGLFLSMQRRPRLLVGLITGFALVFGFTLGLAGWWFGALSLMTAGFAAILVGLVVDYGVLICQEARQVGHDADAIRRATGRSIIAAALTTAAVFFALNLSSLPGIAQLGSLVGAGILIGAALMLTLYLPWVARVGADRRAPDPEVPTPPRKGILAGGLGLALAAAAVLTALGPPGVVFEQSLLRPKNSAAMAAYERMREHFPEWDQDALKWIVAGPDDATVRARAEAARERLASAETQRPELIESARLPLEWWPSPTHAAANHESLSRLAERRDELLAAAGESGFSERGLALDREILAAIPRVLERPADVRPDGPAARDILRAVVFRRDDGRRGLLGDVALGAAPETLSAAELETLRTLGGDGVSLAGWSLLKPAIRPLVRRDFLRVFLPMLGLMVAMLTLVFRDFRDVATALLAMALSALLLLATMRLIGLEWNFLNIAATPLLLGTGLDYLIHILLSLRRHRGDRRRVWHGTGKAVVFCGASTAIGFGSLAFASIDALASLGLVAVTGILITTVVAVVLVPALRTYPETR
jgi:predicted exporter